MFIGNVPRLQKLVRCVVFGSLVAGGTLGACTRSQGNDAQDTEVVAAALSTPAAPAAAAATSGLTLQVLTNSCGTNQVENFFQVTNNGTTAVPLSAIQIKFWPDDTSGQRVVPQVFYGGCVSDAGNPSCVHQVSGVTAAPATSFAACGPSPQQQANWEVTISNSDNTLLPPGATWSNIQSQVHLANFGNFSPGTADWYSSCVSSGSGGSYVSTGTFAIYDAGQLVRSSTGVPPSCRAPSGTQTITGNVPPAVTTAPLVGSLPGSTVLTLNIALALQLNGATGSGAPPITTFINQLSDPTATSHPAPLTPAGFAAAYGPTGTDYTNLTSFATANGLTVARTFTARNMLAVTGTVAAIENAFFVTLNVYRRPDGTTFYAPANDPSLNPGASVTSIPIVYIGGLDNFAKSFHSGGTVPGTCSQSPIGAKNAFFGSDFANAYFSGCASQLGQGQGQTVALFEQDSYLASDITAFTQGTLLGESALNVPVNLTNVTQEVVPSSTSVPFATVTFPPNGKANNGDNGEVALDMSMVLGVAPRANLIVYENNNGAVTQSLILAQIADDDKAQTISSSWWWGFSTNNEQLAVQSVLYQFAAQSQSFFEASGDLGAFIATSPYNNTSAGPLPTPPEPHIDSPYITVVGGTELTTTGTAGTLGAYSAETAWNDTSGPRTLTSTVNGVLQTNVPQNSVTAGGFCTGTSPSAPGSTPLTALPLPSWQVGVTTTNGEVNNNPSNARMIPDVSLVATDLGIVLNGGAACSGGTSASAPLWAAFTALINQANGVGSGSGRSPIGFLNPTLYHFASASAANFNDIADGSNNDWFDDGQKVEGSSDGAGTPTAPFAQTNSNAMPPVVTTSALPGAPVAGTSEAAGLYHAVTGYDLVAGLGTPTCGFLGAVAPTLNPPPPPPQTVTVTYEQVGACNGFIDINDPNDLVSAGPGFAFVFFGITSIDNEGTTPFTVQLANMFVPPDTFASDLGSQLAESVYAPFAEPTSETLTAGGSVQFQVDAIVGMATVPSTSSTTVGSFLLNYSVNPGDPSATNPQVVFVKSNSATTSFAITPDCNDIIF